MAKDLRVIAVVVAYNRRELLAEVLHSLRHQKRPVDGIVVVNNDSADDSPDVVRSMAPQATLVELSRNTGGAGGFAVGMATAVARFDPDWVWVMDDDTVPAANALSGLLAAISAYPRADLVAVGSRVVWTDGSDHPMNTPRVNPFAMPSEKRWARTVHSIPVRSLSFVSSMYRADRVVALGYPIADYFLWNDDFEYSSRIIRGNRALSVPASVVVHKTKASAATDADPGHRFKFEVRNKLWLFRYSQGLNVAEKLVYGVSSLIRWARTFAKSPDRKLLRTGLMEGVREAMTRRPQPNSIAVADANVPSDALAEIVRAT